MLHLLAERHCFDWQPPNQHMERLARWLIRERHCSVDAQDLYCKTPLWTAAAKHNLGVLRALIAGGATVNYVLPMNYRIKSFEDRRLSFRYYQQPKLLAMLLLDAGYQHPCQPDPPWSEDWLAYRALLWSKTVALLGVWQRRQPNATHAVDRHVMRYIVELVWKRRFVWEPK
jgi:hypothetical protein